MIMTEWYLFLLSNIILNKGYRQKSKWVVLKWFQLESTSEDLSNHQTYLTPSWYLKWNQRNAVQSPFSTVNPFISYQPGAKDIHELMVLVLSHVFAWIPMIYNLWVLQHTSCGVCFCLNSLLSNNRCTPILGPSSYNITPVANHNKPWYIFIIWCHLLKSGKSLKF